jgi:hypothetical protein
VRDGVLFLVEVLDVLGVVLHDYVAAEGEFEAEFAVLLGPVSGEDGEFLDAFCLGDRLVGVVDG